ncbi:MAG: hypothetical protein ABI268_02060 [Rhodanobacter sp.]
MTTLNTQWNDLKRQAEATPWLKWAVLAITIMLAAFMLQTLDGLRLDSRKTAIEAETKLQRIHALQGQNVWFKREKDATELRNALWAQLPTVDTSGMAQAAVQNWLRNLTSSFSAAQNVRIRVNQVGLVTELPGVIRVNASLSGNLSPRQALGILRQIESSTNLIVAETVSIQSDSSDVFQLTLNAYYRTAAAGPR